jgi:hypothetical protein
MMNMRFIEVMNGMDGLRTKVSSLYDGLICKGPECRRLARRAISLVKEFIAKKYR